MFLPRQESQTIYFFLSLSRSRTSFLCRVRYTERRSGCRRRRGGGGLFGKGWEGGWRGRGKGGGVWKVEWCVFRKAGDEGERDERKVKRLR